MNESLKAPQVLAAIVTGVVSLVLAIWAFLIGIVNQKKMIRNQEEIEIMKTDLTKDVERLKSELAEAKSKNDARRAYEFDARKRLYQEYEPLLFQLMEACDNAIHRIQSLARTAKNGDLEADGWLSKFNYYSKSTLYNLFVPLAIYQIMQRKITLVDVSVDKSIGLYYKLIKQAYIAFTDDFELARMAQPIVYEPDYKNNKINREQNQATYWKQGLPIGILEKTIEFLIESDSAGKERVISYGRFEKKIATVTPENLSDINLSRDVFLLFHPQRRPVLWRLIIVEAIIFNALLELKKVQTTDLNDDIVRDALLNMRPEFIDKFIWQEDDKMQEDANDNPFFAAKEYLAKRF